MAKAPVAVVAVGGNALAFGSGDLVGRICRGLVDMAATGWRLVLVHGSGPQVGYILRRAELAASELPPVSMAEATAQVQGALGYAFQSSLQREAALAGRSCAATTVITQVVVSPDDPAFAKPDKPVGGYLEKAKAERLARELGWAVREVPGRGWRRVVPSPRPTCVVELAAIQNLLAAGQIVIAGGGGGIAVQRAPDNATQPVDAVVDKDHTASLIARRCGAVLYLNLTETPGVALGFSGPDPAWQARMSVADARRHLAAGHFPPGSMGPKVASVIEFLGHAGGRAAIASAASFQGDPATLSATWFEGGRESRGTP